MGCQQSKSAITVTRRNPNNSSSNDQGAKLKDPNTSSSNAVVSKRNIQRSGGNRNGVVDASITESTTDDLVLQSTDTQQTTAATTTSSSSSSSSKKKNSSALQLLKSSNSKESSKASGKGLLSSSSSIKKMVATSSSSPVSPNTLYSELLIRIGEQSSTIASPKNIIKPPSLTASLHDHVSTTTVKYRDTNTKQTPLHLAIQLYCQTSRSDEGIYNNRQPMKPGSSTGNQIQLLQLIRTLLEMYPQANAIRDQDGYIPIHYIIAASSNSTIPTTTMDMHKQNAALLTLLLESITTNAVLEQNLNKGTQIFGTAHTALTRYLNRNDVKYTDKSGSRCTPLYRVVSMLPDDPTSTSPPTLLFLQALLQQHQNHPITITNSILSSVFVGNVSNQDTPLNLLYRRFTRQFDMAEQFFSGDNSRPEVLAHREYYKTAASTTWKQIELLLLFNNSSNTGERRRLTHCAVSGSTPPDLLRYIVETNAEDLVIPDTVSNKQRLPLHCAAAAATDIATTNDDQEETTTTYPAFYSKYVIDELLYKYPEAASQRDADGALPLTLAVQAGKKWIGGGIKSLYDAYPEAINDIDLQQYPGLQAALAIEIGLDNDENDNSANAQKTTDSIQDEPHDAIMLVQSENVDISEIVTSLWAHEEDAGVQMLGCVAITKLLNSKQQSTMRIALPSVPAVVNAMKAHPNEVIVQEKACHVLTLLASADGQREISFVASGAVAAIVGAMQAHVADATVQQEACSALGRIMHYGGTDRATIVASVSGFTAILNSLTAHPNHVGVQRFGCLALRELTNPGTLLPIFSKSQAESLLLHAQINHPQECHESVAILLPRLV